MKTKLVCTESQKEYDPASMAWRSETGALLDIKPYEMSFPWEKISKRASTMWRYLEALPISYENVSSITMGEGFTPMVSFDRTTPNMLVKLDFLMPTLSFKDRGAAMLMAVAKELGVKHVIADSSGNAGTAVAAYASRAGIECDIYVPGSTSTKKLKQIEAHDAKVHAIPGTREDTAAAAIRAVEETGAFYASHVYNPFFYEGTKTYTFEIFEQLGYQMPDTVIVPVGNGTMLLGAYYGFTQLMEHGFGDKLPRIIAIQAEGCAPLAKAFKEGKKEAEPVVNTGTVAEGIAIAAPARHKQILDAIKKTDGVIITAPEDQLQNASRILAGKGFYVEPTTAANYAGFLHYLETYHVDMNDLGTVVLPLCGAGLKSSD